MIAKLIEFVSVLAVFDLDTNSAVMKTYSF